MAILEIIKPGLMTSIQDLGRKGLAFYAIPRSGVMDRNAAKIALLLLNEKEESPLIECTSLAPQILFKSPAQIAITGADFNWRINDEKVNRNTLLNVKKGDVLKGQFAKDGLRGYIAVKGKLKLDKVYDSFSTYTNARIGGLDGRLLKRGDVLKWTSVENKESDLQILPIKPGPEFSYLSEKSKEELFTNIYKINPDSNRMGIRLDGSPLSDPLNPLENSVPVLPGFIQMPPSGLPIIVLQDGQTTGGYPRIAYVAEENLSTLNQIPLGGSLRFRISTAISKR